MGNPETIAASASTGEVWDAWLPTVSGEPGSPLDRSLLDWEGRRFLAGAAGAGISALGTPPVRVYAGVDHGSSAVERADRAVDKLARLGGLERRLLVVCSPTGTGYVNTAALTAAELLSDGDCASVALQFGTARSTSSMGGLGAASASLRALLERLARHDRPARTVLWAESFGSWALLDALVRNDRHGLARVADSVIVVGVPGPALIDGAMRARLDAIAGKGVVARDGADLAREPAHGTHVLLIHDDDPVAHVPGTSIAWRPQRHTLRTGIDTTVPARRYRRGWLPVVTGLRARREIDDATRPGGPARLRREHDYRYAAFDLVRIASGIEANNPAAGRALVGRVEQHLHDALEWIGPQPALHDPWRDAATPATPFGSD